jgi:hypothetical protein
VLSGDRTSRDREIRGAVPGRAVPGSPTVKVNLGLSPLAPRNLDLSTSRVPKLRCRASTPPGLHYVSGVPLCHVRFGTSRISEPTTLSPLLLKSPTAESPILRIRATCPSRNRRSQSDRGIALRDFDVHGILALTNPDSPICDGQGFFRCLRVNSLTPSPRSNDPRSFASPADGFRTVDSPLRRRDP